MSKYPATFTPGMRVLLVALCLVMAPAAYGANGFRESGKLSQIATAIAGKPTHVLCATSVSEWIALRSKYPLGPVPAFSFSDQSESYFRPGLCEALERWKPSAKITRSFAYDLIVFTHESIHDSGQKDELITQCLARKRVAEVAIRFFGFKPYTAKIRSLVRLAYQTSAALYYSPRC